MTVWLTPRTVRSYQPRPDLSGIDTSGPADHRYEILGRIASGAMGQVFVARMRRRSGVAAEVVLKRIRPELQLEPGVVEMFYDEAHIASQMDHPNIIRIYELGELDGSMFISMELVEGANLSGLLRHLVGAGRRLPPPVMLNIAVSVLDALAYAHDFTGPDGRPLNIIHRDVSPQNIMVSFEGDVKLFDFGVTKAEGRLHKTHPGLLKGKLAYMAPEQIRADEHIDRRADLFALGVLLYEALLFRHPFYGRTDAMVLRAIMEQDPASPFDLDPSFPPELWRIIQRALAKSPEDRYPNARTMLNDLEMFMRRDRIGASKQMVARFMRRELEYRIEAIARARASGDNRALVEALREGTKKTVSERGVKPPPSAENPTEPELPTIKKFGAPKRPPLQLPASAPPSEDLLGAMDVRRTAETDTVDLVPNRIDDAREPPPARLPPPRRQSQALLLPESMSANISRTGLHLANVVTGDLTLEDSTPDAISRSTVDEVLDDAYSEAPDTNLANEAGPNAETKDLEQYAIEGVDRTTESFVEYVATRRGPRGFRRPVRILRLPDGAPPDDPRMEHLVDCARASALWTHTNLIQTLDFQEKDGFFWVTEAYPGRRLDAIFTRARATGRVLPTGAACRIGAELCAALLHMHRHETGTWIHGDVQPSHVLITSDGEVKLGGFEHVRLEERGAPQYAREAGPYAPPEVHDGEPAGPEADVYGVARIIDESLTLKRMRDEGLFTQGELPSLATRSRDVSSRVVRLVDRALLPSPRERGDDLAAMWEALEMTLVDLERPFTALDLKRWLATLYA